METGSRDAAKRVAEIRAALQFFQEALQRASKAYNPEATAKARAAVRMALAGVIQLISELFPDEPSFPTPIIQLQQHLYDLDRGQVAPLLRPAKVRNRPPMTLSEELFRAIVAAAMTRLMEGKRLSRDDAARDVASRLRRIGAKHESGKAITAGQIADWREKMMTELASESHAVARYHLTLQMLVGMEASDAVGLVLDSLTDLAPANFPKNHPT
jgi:hypothetical protein